MRLIVPARLSFPIALAILVSACGRPAAEQPAPQVADGSAPAATAPAAAAPAATPAADFPVVLTPEEILAAAEKIGMQPTPEERMKLVCDNGEKMIVRFFPEQGVGVLVRASGTAEMQRESGAPALRYAGSGVALTGGGENYTVDLGGGTTTACTAA